VNVKLISQGQVWALLYE